MKILSTAILPDTLVNALKSAGFEYVQHAFIHTQILRSDLLRVQLEELSEKEADVIFTSPRAVDALAAYLHGRQPLWRIWGLEGSTYRAIKTLWTNPMMAGLAPDAASLAECLLQEGAERDYVFFCGNLSLPILPEKLAAAGVHLQKYLVYTTETHTLDYDERWDAVLFYSPSGVESFAQSNTLAGSARVFAIGQTTAEAAGKRFANPVHIAAIPDKQVLVQTLIDYYLTKTH